MLLGHRLKPQIIVSHKNSSCCLIPASDTTEKNLLINWNSSDFGASYVVFTQSCSLTKDEAERLVQELVLESKSFEVKPHAPFSSRYTRMIVLAQQHGREAFLCAGKAFLDAEPWLPNVRGHDIDRDSWREFAEHFYIYERKWRAELKRKAEERQRATERKKAEVPEETQEEREAKRLAIVSESHRLMGKLITATRGRRFENPDDDKVWGVKANDLISQIKRATDLVQLHRIEAGVDAFAREYRAATYEIIYVEDKDGFLLRGE